MDRLLKLIFIGILFCSCTNNNSRTNAEVAMVSEVTDTIPEEVTIPIKDSIDTLIEQRATEDLNTTIFANLRFGASSQMVERALQNTKYRVIQVPKNDQVKEVYIRTYDAEYYDNQLASLTLYAEEDELYYTLGRLFATKYGKTKSNKWHYANCEITIEYGVRSSYNPYNNPNFEMYYDSFRGERTNAVTKDASFLKITYKHYHYLEMIERQKHIADSLDNAKKLKEREEEKKLARRLATETATGI